MKMLAKAGMVLVMVFSAACSTAPTGEGPTPTSTNSQAAATSTNVSEPVQTSTPEPRATVTLTPSQAAVPTQITPESTPVDFMPDDFAPEEKNATAQAPTATATALPPTSATFTPNCPMVNPDLELDLSNYFEDDERKSFLELLNAGYSPQVIVQEAREHLFSGPGDEYAAFELDLTGNGVLEFVDRDIFNIDIYYCRNGKYETLFEYQLYPYAIEVNVEYAGDINQNGLAELVMDSRVTFGADSLVQILEWDGSEFKNLLNNRYEDESWLASPEGRGLTWYAGLDESLENDSAYVNSGAQITVQDWDGDGMEDVLLTGGIESTLDIYCNGQPWRDFTKVYRWDGQYFVYAGLELPPASYRFQAVQEGDRLSIMGEWEEARKQYQNAIISDQLESLSELSSAQQSWECYQSGPFPELSVELDDTDDRLFLAAYSRFRLMLLDLLSGREGDAQATYEKLAAWYPPGNDGFIITEMAEGFWQVYQSTGELELACARAVEFASEHEEEILPKLGSWRHGYQSHTYVPADVCPFNHDLLKWNE